MITSRALRAASVLLSAITMVWLYKIWHEPRRHARGKRGAVCVSEWNLLSRKVCLSEGGGGGGGGYIVGDK